MKMKEYRSSESDQVANEEMRIDDFEINLKNAINDLIDIAEFTSKIDSEHISMIITHLAVAAAFIRIKKQNNILEIW